MKSSDGNHNATTNLKVPHMIDVPNHMHKNFGKRSTVELLVDHAKLGNHKAFDLLVIKYQSSVAKVVSSYIRDRSTIADVVQETFIKAYRGLGSFRNESTFYSWIYRIATNTAFNQIRKAQYKHKHLSINDIEYIDLYESNVSNDDPVSTANSDNLKKHLNKILHKLPNDLKTTWLLREMKGLKYEEIAAIVGCQTGTVKSRIFRAREWVAAGMNPFL